MVTLCHKVQTCRGEGAWEWEPCACSTPYLYYRYIESFVIEKKTIHAHHRVQISLEHVTVNFEFMWPIVCIIYKYNL